MKARTPIKGQLRNLDNYKGMWEKQAKAKGCSRELEACDTLTKARKVLREAGCFGGR